MKGVKLKSNEGVSFVVWCNELEEINTYWNALNTLATKTRNHVSFRNKYYVWWQILHTNLDAIMKEGKPL